MKKVYFLLLALFLITPLQEVSARCYYHHHSQPIYVVRSDVYENEGNFTDCKEHYFITKTTVNYYSNGTRRTFNNHTVLNSQGNIIISDCADIKHVIHNKKHYFLIRKGGVYQIADSKGNITSMRKYTKMYDISANRILVKVDKKYGIIDLKENIIVPLKYKSIEKINTDLFLTKLNGYYGMLDSSNRILIKNEYEKIKRLYDTYVLKKYGKYGLADINGKIIIPAENEKIKKLGEYILVKKDKTYQIYSAQGVRLSDNEFKKVKLERNSLRAKLLNNEWIELEYN